MNDNIEKAPNVPPFVTFVTSTVPMVFDNSLSYYEALCALWKWLQDDVVNVINNNATVTEEYIQMTTDMKEYMDNYFDNLDVQEEINNKLDQMAEDGSLQELVDNFLIPNGTMTFDNVATMQASDKMVAGTYAITLGFRTKGDTGGAKYYITSTGTANGMTVIALNNGCFANIVLDEEVNPMQLGAVGNGTTDDATILQYILDNINKPIKFTANHYVGTGLTTTVPRNMYGEHSDCGLTANNDTYVLRLIKDDADIADYRNYKIDSVKISQQGSGDALLLSGWNGRLLEWKIENCKIGTPYTGAVGSAIHVLDASLAHSVITGCTIIGNGIHGEVGDANVISKNMIFGEGIGIKLDTANGVLNNVIRDNTITTFGGNAIYIVNGQEMLIENNQIEYGGSSDQTASDKGMIYLRGLNRRCENIQIIANNFGGGTHLDYDLYLNNCDNVVIDRNRFVAVNQAEIYIGSSSSRTKVRRGNYGVSQDSNPRTGLEDKYIVDDNGDGTMGVWKEINIQGGTTQKLKFLKDENGFLHFKDFYIANLSEQNICTLPQLFRPSATYMLKATSHTLETEYNIKVSYTGAITLTSMPSTQTSLIIIGTFPANNYLI